MGTTPPVKANGRVLADTLLTLAKRAFIASFAKAVGTPSET